MFKIFTLQLRPNVAQLAQFEYILSDNCETYNAALQECIEAWKLERKHISYFDQCKELTELRKEIHFQKVSLEIQRDPLDRLHKSFTGFFRRCKLGKKPGYPRFRSRSRYSSFSFGGSHGVKILSNKISIPKIGYLKFKISQQIIGTPKQATVKQIGKHWIIRLCCDIGPTLEHVPVSSAIGIDLGITNFLALSNGTFVENPKWTNRHSAKIAAANRSLARKQRRSKNRLRAKEVLRRTYQRMADARRNFLHFLNSW